MKRIRIDIRTENDAFQAYSPLGGAGVEVSTILKGLANDFLMAGGDSGAMNREFRLRDSNGNTVGSVKIT